MTWKLAEAKNRLSEVVNLALSEGPQTISRRGDELILISKDEYLRRTGEKESFTEFLLGGPSLEGVDLSRPAEGMRTVSL
jgi:prevent-host-death family protein